MTQPNLDNQPVLDQGKLGQPVDRLTGPRRAGRGVNLNVEGRQVTGPVQGFGQMWQKTYTIRLTGSPVIPAGGDPGLEG